MKKKIVIVGVIALLLITLFGSIKVGVFNTSALSIQDKKYKEILKNDEGKDILTVEANIPVVKLSEEDNEKQFINDYIDSYYTDYTNRIKNYVYPVAKENYRVLDENENDAAYTFYAFTNYDVINNNGKVLALKMIEETYTGGVHGTHYVMGMNFDLVNNKYITLDDIFKIKKEEYEKILYDLINENIKNQMTNENVYFFETYKEEIKNAFSNDRFIITNDGIEFIYEEYEITPYSEGTKLIKINYNDIKDYANELYFN